MTALILVPASGGAGVACDSLYYRAMKKVGYEKRDILLKRIRSTIAIDASYAAASRPRTPR